MACGFAQAALAEQVIIVAGKDNTLIQNPMGVQSNGAGPNFFIGRTGQVMNSLRRGLLWFDVASAVPAGATIDGVTLTLHVSRTRAEPTSIALHRVLSDWGEGASLALPGEEESTGGSRGAPAEMGDATWLHTFFDTGFWTTPGGDFAETASGSAVVVDIGFYAWGSTPAMVTDVQSWLDELSGNFGWILVDDESMSATSKRFDTREHPEPSFRPMLTIDFTPLMEACCLGTGDCFQTTTNDCIGMLGGTPLGPDTTCGDETTCCQPPGACDDDNACTTDSCAANQCVHMPIEGCVPCLTDNDCDDADACMEDICFAGQCTHEAIDGCVPCLTDDDCDDGDACMEDICLDGQCTHEAIEGCGEPPGGMGPGRRMCGLFGMMNLFLTLAGLIAMCASTRKLRLHKGRGGH